MSNENDDTAKEKDASESKRKEGLLSSNEAVDEGSDGIESNKSSEKNNDDVVEYFEYANGSNKGVDEGTNGVEKDDNSHAIEQNSETINHSPSTITNPSTVMYEGELIIPINSIIRLLFYYYDFFLVFRNAN